MKKLFVECLGSFILSTLMIISVLQDSWTIASCIGSLAVCGLLYSGGHISGGHFNPVISIAVFLRGRISVKDLPAYILAQFIGSALAAVATLIILSGKVGNPVVLDKQIISAMISEIIGSFIICFVFLNVATSKTTLGNSFYGIALGAVYGACLLVFGKISYGAFNPALGLGMAISQVTGFGNLWILWLAEAVGSVAAALAFVWIHGKD